MRIVNSERVFGVVRKYLFLFFIALTFSTSLILLSQEKIEQYSYLMPPELMGLEVVGICTTAFLIIFVLTSILLSIHLYKILSSEYFRIIDGFIEGPTVNGERQILSYSQIHDMGRDLFGQFTISGETLSLVLPGKLSVSQERKLQRLIKKSVSR